MVLGNKINLKHDSFFIPTIILLFIVSRIFTTRDQRLCLVNRDLVRSYLSI